MNTPVVMSTVHVVVGADGAALVDIDGRAYDAGAPITRADLHRVIDAITSNLATAVRVEVREADGSTYADIALPPELPAPTPEACPSAAPTTALVGAGFQPGEEVALAYVVVRQTADSAGNASLNLPPAVAAAARDGLVMLGLTTLNATRVEASA